MADLIAIVGPTACGKTRRAVEAARCFGGEIVSGDSRQVYLGMDIGTGKDLGEYGEVPFHLINIRPPGYKYNLHEFLADYDRAVADIRLRGKLPILCGGTGMYVETALSGIRLPEVPRNEELRRSLQGKDLAALTGILSGMKRLHNSTDVDTVQRALRAIEIETYYRDNPEAYRASRRDGATRADALIIGLCIPRDDRRRRISERLERRLEEGMTDEVKALLENGVSADDLIYYGLEYKFVTLYVTGKLSYDEMRRQLEIAIHQFAKRQMTWFRGMERRGFHIDWLPYDLEEKEFLARLQELLEKV